MKKYRIIRKYTENSEWYVIQVPRVLFGGWKTLKVKAGLGPNCIGACAADYVPRWQERSFQSAEDAREWMGYEPMKIEEEIVEEE